MSKIHGIEVIGELDNEIAANVLMTEGDRHVLVGAVCLGSAVLMEGVPGTGKTTIGKTTATAIGGEFGRIQGAPDLFPGDITGVSVWNPAASEWEFKQGPIFSNVLLADEINRMSPKTQAALLQGMQEKQVTDTATNKTRDLPSPFIVLGTQNPNEIGQGTYPLTKANLDRFAVSIALPQFNEAQLLAVADLSGQPSQVISPDELLVAGYAIESRAASVEVKQRAARIIMALRELDVVSVNDSVLGGARPIQQLIAHAKALSILNPVSEAQGAVSVEHVDKVAPYVLSHRTELTDSAEYNKIPLQEVIETAIRKAA